MNIRLTPEQEQIINEQLKAGHYRSAEEVIDEALLSLRKRLGAYEPSQTGDYSDAVREMQDFVEAHHVRLEGVTVRELIHEGHRL